MVTSDWLRSFVVVRTWSSAARVRRLGGRLRPGMQKMRRRVARPDIGVAGIVELAQALHGHCEPGLR
jgi:hypothetical protein